ncbi:MAG: PTS transporter subunit EIIC [Atopobiaceae bacterium]|nr:PTS transporter subunit EIIC [Atopobiaceae bacterium]
MARDWNKLATDVIELVGGEENIASITHCVTRLRFRLKDESKADDQRIGQLEGVIQVLHASGQYQVVIGNKVGEAYDAVVAQLPGLAGGEVAADAEEEKGGFSLNALFDIVSGIFVPFIGIFTAAGLTRALVTMCVTLGLFTQESSTFVVLNAIGDGVFQFLPIFIARNAAKKFKCNEWIAMAVAAFLVTPSMVGLKDAFAEAGGPTLFGLPVILPDSGYLQSVFPIIFATYLQSWIEKPVSKMPQLARDLVGNMIVLVCTSLITLLVVGPVVNTVSGWIAAGLMAILNVAPVVAGFLIAALWPVLIIFGMHWGMIPIMISNLMTLGYDVIGPITNATNYVVGAVVLAILLKTKKQNVKATATECLASAWLGAITEPAIYGLLLKFKRPFVAMALSCGICGAITAAVGVHQVGILTTSVLTLPILAANLGMPHMIAIALASIAGFVSTYLFAFDDSMVVDE